MSLTEAAVESTTTNTEGSGTDVGRLPWLWISKPWITSLGSYNIILEIICSVLTVLGNSVIVFTILRPRNKDRLRTPLHLLILQLSVSDLLVGSIAEPLTIYTFVRGIYDSVSCTFFLILVLTLGKAAVLSFVLLSVERFVAIRFPYKHGRIFSQRNGVIMWGGMWIVSFVYGIVPAVLGMDRNWNENIGCVFTYIIPLEYLITFTVLGTYAVEGVIIVVIYSYLFLVVRRQLSRIASLQIQQQPEAPSQIGNKFRMELKAAYRCFLMILVHVLCQWPLSVTNVLQWGGVYISPATIQHVLMLRRINSAINPLCYAFTTRMLRQTLRDILPCSRTGVYPG